MTISSQGQGQIARNTRKKPGNLNDCKLQKGKGVLVMIFGEVANIYKSSTCIILMSCNGVCGAASVSVTDSSVPMYTEASEGITVIEYFSVHCVHGIRFN